MLENGREQLGKWKDLGSDTATQTSAESDRENGKTKKNKRGKGEGI